MKRIVILAVCVFLGASAGAQTNVPVRDFGAGFAKFIQLGLPDVRGGVYGRIEFEFNEEEVEGSDLDSLGLAGNAWKMADLGGGSNRYVYGVVRVVEAMETKSYDKWAARMENRLALGRQDFDEAEWEEPDFAVVTWKAVDLGKDVAKLLARLDKPDEDTKSGFEYDSAIGGEFLLMAAQLYRLGMTNEANRIAARLFALCPDTKELMQQAITSLAYAQYRQSYARFVKTGDWREWHRELTALLARFPNGWRDAPGVRKLADLVGVRVARPELPSLSGEGLSAEDQKLARRLASEPPRKEAWRGSTAFLGGEQCWLFSRKPGVRAGREAATNDVVVEITGRGMKSVPMLIAMLKDETLVRPEWKVEDAFLTREDGVSSAEQVFSTLERPRTRGEVARALLIPLLLLEPRQRDELRSAGQDDFAAECMAWHKEHKDRALADLAKLYLEKGDPAQRQNALGWLMRGTNVEVYAADVEGILVGIAAETRDTPGVLRQYVERRREKASNFVERVVGAMLGTNAAPRKADVRGGRLATRGDMARMAEQRRSLFVEQLRNLAAVKPVADLVSAYLSATQSADQASARLAEQLGREDPHKSLDLLLDAARRTEDLAKRTELLTLTRVLKYAKAGGRDDEDDLSYGAGPATPVPNKFAVAKHAALWREFLADRRGKDQRVSAAAAWSVTVLYAKDPPQQKQTLPHIVPVLGRAGMPLLVAHADAILAGKPLPELPDAARVDAARREKLVATLTKAGDAADAYARLTLDEQLAMVEVGYTNCVLNAKLRPVADRIAGVDVAPELAGSGLEARLKGRKFDAGTVRILHEVALDLAGKGFAFDLTMARVPNAGGMEVALSVPDSKELPAHRRPMDAGETNRVAVTDVTGSIHGGPRSMSARWTVGGAARGALGRTGEAAGGGDFEARLMDLMEAGLREAVGHELARNERRFWEYVDLVVEKAGAYAPVEVVFAARRTVQ